MLHPDDTASLQIPFSNHVPEARQHPAVSLSGQDYDQGSENNRALRSLHGSFDRHTISSVPKSKQYSRRGSSSTVESEATSDSSLDVTSFNGSLLYASSVILHPAGTFVTTSSVSDLLSNKQDQGNESTEFTDASVEEFAGFDEFPDAGSNQNESVPAKSELPSLVRTQSWMQQAADYETTLTSGETKYMPDEISRELADKSSPDESPSVSIAVEEHEQVPNNVEIAQCETVSRDFVHNISTGLPKLNATNLAKADQESHPHVHSKTNNPSDVSVAGTETTALAENGSDSTQREPVTRSRRTARIALIGDGLCGKTSFLQ